MDQITVVIGFRVGYGGEGDGPMVHDGSRVTSSHTCDIQATTVSLVYARCYLYDDSTKYYFLKLMIYLFNS